MTCGGVVHIAADKVVIDVNKNRAWTEWLSNTRYGWLILDPQSSADEVPKTSSTAGQFQSLKKVRNPS